jgi:hypothetical protein
MCVYVCVYVRVCVYMFLSVPTFVADQKTLQIFECPLCPCRTAKFHKFFVKINNNNMTDLGTREVGVTFAAVSMGSS